MVASESGDATFAFPDNQLLVFMEEGKQREDVDWIAETIDATVVGQVPELQIYQLAFTSRSVEELFTTMAALEQEEGVETAVVNFLTSFPHTPSLVTNEPSTARNWPNYDLRDGDLPNCPSQSDNSGLDVEKRAPFLLVDYE